MSILWESTICLGAVPKGLSKKMVRLVLAMFGCGLEFNGAKKNLPSSRNGVFPAVMSLLPSVRNTKSSAAAGRFAAAAAVEA